MTDYLLKKDKGFFIKEFKKLKPEELRKISSELSIKILNELSKEPNYPNALAKKLKIHEQKIYYHINALKKTGLIKVSKSEEIKGSTANYYETTMKSFGTELEGDYEKINLKDEPEQLKKFFKEYNTNGKFNGLIVVGSPLPHGQFKAVARDGHYSAQLGMIIGGLMKPGDFNIKLDTDLINEKKLDENLILIGGPGTNLITAMINKDLPIKFNEENYWNSIKGRQEHTDELCGVIEKIANPYNKNKTIIVLAGLRVSGTKASIIGLSDNKTLKDYDKGNFSTIVKGYDYDGDGKIDGVEVIE